jgi:DNA-directed RNA polymerase-3 subunit RPC5
MTAARIDEDDDPVTAEYDVYLTPSISEQSQQIYVLQYPNRPRNLPYNYQFGMQPDSMRIKPQSGYLEMDVRMNTERNFNKYQALKWGDAARTARQLQQNHQLGDNVALSDADEPPPPTYGLAAGLGVGGRPSSRRGANAGVAVKDAADREHDIQNDIVSFDDALSEKKVLRSQTLGSHIIHHASSEESGKPVYYVGAFRGKELHLSRVTGTAQMRPQFHHLDAEDHRNRANGGRDYAPTTPAAAQPTTEAPADGAPGSSTTKPATEKVRAVHASYKANPITNPRGELEEQTNAMRTALQAAAEEPWTSLEHVDEDAELAYAVFDERMFLSDTKGAVRLQSEIGNEQFLDRISGRIRR